MRLIEKSTQIELSKIRKSAYFFRDEPAEEDIRALAESIKVRGQIHPVSVVRLSKKTAKGHEFELTNGHRRYLACQLVSLPTIRADIYEYTPEELADESERQSAIVQFLHDANMQEPLTPVERAQQFVAMMETFDLTPKALAEMFHRSVEEVEEDLKYAFIDRKVREEISKPDSARKLTREHLQILANYSAPTKRGWRLNPEQQMEVVKKLLTGEDKRLQDRPILLEKEIRDLKKQARDAKKVEEDRPSGPDQVLRELFRRVDRVEKAVTELYQVEVPAGMKMGFVDRKAMISRLANVARGVLDFVDQKLPVEIAQRREEGVLAAAGGIPNDER